MTHLLDSSAFFAFFFGEPGGERVAELFQDPAAEVGISVLSVVELWGRLKAAGREDVCKQEWEDHLPLFVCVVVVDPAVCFKAIELRQAATGRLPTIDSLIAAGAALAGATLVQRDPHFASIPSDLLKQELIA